MDQRGTESTIVGRAATAADLPAVADCLTSAFHDDPVWGPWVFPDVATRARLLLRFVEFCLESALHPPWLRLAEDGAAVTVWMPPGVSELTPAQEARLAPLLEELCGSRAPAVATLLEDFEADHPVEPAHYTLAWWATHPRHAGRGLGTALIREDLARIDAEHVPAYLDSTNPRNGDRYEALGFRACGAFGPPGGPSITRMWREGR